MMNWLLTQINADNLAKNRSLAQNASTRIIIIFIEVLHFWWRDKYSDMTSMSFFVRFCFISPQFRISSSFKMRTHFNILQVACCFADEGQGTASYIERFEG